MNICRICDSQADHSHYQPQERMFGWGDTFDYFKCQDCGCLQIASVPADLARYYPSQYYSLNNKPRARPGLPMRLLYRKRILYRLTGKDSIWERLTWRLSGLPYGATETLPYLKHISGIRHDTPFLDVGCGENSEWLGTLSRCGFTSLVGADPYLSNAGKREGINYQKATLDQVQGQFDVITFHHSLEHIPDQRATMKIVHRLLAHGGTCLIRIPLVDSLVWERYGLNWVELDAPRHLYLHSQVSVARLAVESGLEVVHTLYDSTEFEFAGSEQYLLGLPLTAPNSFWINPLDNIFTEEQMNGFRDMACQANLQGRGGRAAFFLRKCSSA
jgi:SAM-dependent methyltransferase